MKYRSKKIVRLFVVSLLIVPICYVINYLMKDEILLYAINRNQDKIFLSKIVSPGYKIKFLYIHSVQKTTVIEIYTINSDAQLVLLETKVQSVGFGLPDPKQNNKYFFENGFLVIKNINKLIKILLIRINFVRLMELSFGSKVFDLRDCGKGGDLIEVGAKKVKNYQKMLSLF